MSYLFRLLRFVVLWTDFIVLTTIMYGLTFIPNIRHGRLYPLLFRMWSRLFVRALGVDLVLHEKNLKPLPGHYVMIANHPSIFEDIGIPALFDVVCLAKAEVRQWWIMGRIAAASGTIFVQRENRESRKAALDNIVAALNAGNNVALYPEGGCTGRRINPRFYYGAFEASLRTGLPIIPVLLHYEAQETFEWGNQTAWEKVKQIMRTPNHRANYIVHDAIYPDGFDNAQDYMDHVHQQYLKWQARYFD